MGSHADAAFANPDALAGKSPRRGESPSCYAAHKSASCTHCSGEACSIPSTGHVQALLCLLAQLPLLVQQSHIALSHAPCSYPQTASPCFALQISLSIISTQTLQVRGVFKDSFCAHFDSTSFIPTFTVRRICLQFWAFSELLRWDLWEAGEVPTVPSGSFAPALGCPDQGFL